MSQKQLVVGECWGGRFKSTINIPNIKGVVKSLQDFLEVKWCFKVYKSDEDIERIIQCLTEYEVITRESRITSCDPIGEEGAIEGAPLLSINGGREKGYDFVVYSKSKIMADGSLDQLDGSYYQVNLTEGEEPKYEVKRHIIWKRTKRIACPDTIHEKFIYPIKHDFVEEIDSIAKKTNL